MLIRNHSTVYV
jgi:hypothetical protein